MIGFFVKMTSKYFLSQIYDLNATPDLYVLDYPQKKFTLSAYAHSVILTRVMKKKKRKQEKPEDNDNFKKDNLEQSESVV